MKLNTSIELAVVTVKLKPSLFDPRTIDPPAAVIKALAASMTLRQVPTEFVQAAVAGHPPNEGVPHTIPVGVTSAEV